MRGSWMQFLWVFIGGGVGSMLRHGVNQLSSVVSQDFPFGTVIVNIVGSTALGILSGWFSVQTDRGYWHLFATTGLLGGFTTFSAFSLDVVTLWEGGKAIEAIAYAAGSVGLAIVGVAAGRAIVRAALI